ncbi:MAG: heme-binding protein [Thermaceae bacterium]|nr:heme-binding protein [Thermaceae bacterium]
MSTPTPYGSPITLEQAKKVVATAEAEAFSNGWPVVIAIVDSGGNLVLLHRLDNTQLASVEIAQAKARTANNFRGPSKNFEDSVAGGGVGLRLLAMPGLAPLEGGIPIIVNGQVIGAIGVSGVQSGQDAQIAQAGAEALTP